MEKRKSPRVSLVKSLLCTVLCLGLLVGTTFAWFSDEAGTGDTTITAGNLDVELQVKQENGSFAEADDSTALFDDTVLWEPGMMWKSGAFKVVNAGSLALQYELTLEVTKGEGDLSEVIQMKVAAASELEGKEIATLEDRRALWNSLTAEAGTDYTKGKLLPAGKDEVEGFKVGESDELAVVLFWNPSDSTDLNPEVNPDNKYNAKDDAALTADFSLNVFATQVPYESDSFGERYDNIYLAKNDEELRRAVESAGPGDLIDVLPGSYDADIFEGLQSGVDVQGTRGDDGSLETVIDVANVGVSLSAGTISDVLFEKVSEDPGKTIPPLIVLSDGAVMENCEFVDVREKKGNLRPVEINGSATIRKCNFSLNYGIVNSSATGEILIEDCIFDQNVMQPITITGGGVDGHVTLRNCQFLNGSGEISIGGGRSYKTHFDEALKKYVYDLDEDGNRIPEDDDRGKFRVGGGVTMENCLLRGHILVYTNWTTSGNIFKDYAWISFEDYKLSFISQGDDFSQNAYANQSSGTSYLFRGKEIDSSTITIDGNPPKEGWVQPAAQ